jgi:hypothetical protein
MSLKRRRWHFPLPPLPPPRAAGRRGLAHGRAFSISSPLAIGKGADQLSENRKWVPSGGWLELQVA